MHRNESSFYIRESRLQMDLFPGTYREARPNRQISRNDNVVFSLVVDEVRTGRKG